MHHNVVRFEAFVYKDLQLSGLNKSKPVLLKSNSALLRLAEIQQSTCPGDGTNLTAFSMLFRNLNEFNQRQFLKFQYFNLQKKNLQVELPANSIISLLNGESEIYSPALPDFWDFILKRWL